jgi:hypothetical protein
MWSAQALSYEKAIKISNTLLNTTMCYIVPREITLARKSLETESTLSLFRRFNKETYLGTVRDIPYARGQWGRNHKAWWKKRGTRVRRRRPATSQNYNEGE